jgi:hypothetical protein
MAESKSGENPKSGGPIPVVRSVVSNAKFDVEKFDGRNNFGMWQCEVMDVLAQQELDVTLEDKPEEMSEADWKKLNRQACGTIRLCLAKDQKYFVMKESMAKELWNKLEDKYMTKGIENKLYLKRKFFGFRYVEGTSMPEHLNNLNKILADLQNLDVKIDDEDKAVVLINSLPDTYEHLATTLMYGKDTLKFDDVSNALTNDEYRRKDKQAHSRSSGALIVRGRSESKKPSGRNRSASRKRGTSSNRKFPAKDECAFCRQKGHWRKDCPKLQTKGKEHKANVVSMETEDSDSDVALAGTSFDCHSEGWIMDSACTFHICPNKELFSSLDLIDGGVVLMGNDVACKTKGIGKIRLKLHDGSARVLKEVRYVPDMKKNLISLGVLESKGYKITMENGIMKVISGALVMMKATRKNNLYHLQGTTIVGAAATISDNSKKVIPNNNKLWHMKLGHAGEKALQGLAKQGLLDGATTGKFGFCEHCILGKQTRVKFGTAIHNTKGTLDYVHTDVWGPTKVPSLGGKHYFVTFVDDFSRKIWVYSMKHKDEVLGIFLTWKKMIETQTGRRIKRLRSDNGGEYTSDPFLKICQDEGIVRHFTVSRTPQQNGVAERMNRTILEKVRCMLSSAGLGKSFWAEAVNYACHLINRLPTAAIDGKTPTEVWSGKPANDYDKLHVFGCPAYFHVRDSKLDPRAKKAVFLGFSTGVKGYRLWCPELKKVILSRDVTFNDDEMVRKCKMENSQIEESDHSTGKTTQQVELEVPKVSVQPEQINFPVETEEEISDEVEEEAPTQRSLQQPDSIAVSRPRREIRKPARYTDTVAYALPITEEDIPLTYREAISNSDKARWKEAMGEEMQSLYKNQTWKVVQLPKGKKAIGCKWVYTKKEGPAEQDGVRFKARLVAKGYAQKEGIDYNEVFSPVVKHSSIRVLLALVAQFDLELVQLDVKTAFLHGDLEEDIYMTQPDGFKVAGKENLVCKLNRSLYGLKQSPRQWYKRFDQFMMRQKYTRSQFDHCVYFRKLQDGTFIYLLLYVDDMLIACKSIVEIDRLKTQLKNEFEMKDLGEAKKILGMEITRERARGIVCLTQKQYLKKVLKRFGMDQNTKPTTTPLAPHFKLSAAMSPSTDEERDHMAHVPYANLVGSLMYAMVCTRPDISQAVSMVSRYMHAPGKGHWQAAKWILRYILGTVDVGLKFERVNSGLDQILVGYVDSDYAGDLDKRRSTTGYVFTLAGGPVSWRSTLQTTVALSTTEAEYMAVADAIKEAIWLHGLIEDLGILQKNVKVLCDSQSAIHLAKNQVHHARTKHIDVRFHFVREIMEEGDILLQKIGTADNPADMLTKVVTGAKFKHCLGLANIVKI